jgi:septum site-determining protein MinC
MASIATSTAQATGEPAFEVKGTIAPVTVLCLRTVDVERIERELRARVAQAPQLFANAPIVIDLADVPVGDELPLAAIVERTRACKLVPVGIAHLPAEQLGLAAEVGLAIMQLGFGRSRMARSQSQAVVPPGNETHHTVEVPKAVKTIDPPANTPVVQNPIHEPAALTMTVRQPVRGGQVLYSKGGDLVVVSSVNSGAQVIADGHVHIYGPLRGRALAGAHGQVDARVFCLSLEAELVSIAGEFMSADDIPQKLRGKPAQIFVEHGELRVLAL